MSQHVFSEGHRLAVVFMFYDNGKILIEHRPKSFEGVYIPSGAVEKKDMEHEDYLAAAMKREAKEELGVIPTEYQHLGTFKVKKPTETGSEMFWAHGFLVTSWEGQMPEHITEEGVKSRVEWIELKDYRKHLKWPSAIYFCKKAIEKTK
jgi:8-oxo-dGTP pyrophosphatase MutT (NUDIX family)